MRTLTAAVALSLACVGGAMGGEAGESLRPEALLPVHEGLDAYHPAVAFGKGGYLLVWEAGRMAPGSLVDRAAITGTADIVGCRVDTSGQALDAKPFVVSGARDIQERPRVVFGKDVFLVVWQDLRNEKDYDVFAARVTPDGKALDPDGILVSGGAHNQSSPRVTWDGASFLVAFEDARSGRYEVRGARVSTAGKVLDAEGTLIYSNKGAHSLLPAVAGAGGAGHGRALVVCHNSPEKWGDQPGSNVPTEVFIRDGKVEKTLELKTQSLAYCSPFPPVAMAAGPKGFMIVWRNLASVGRSTPSRNANAGFIGLEGEWEPPKMKSPTTAESYGSAFSLGGHILDPDVVWDGAGFVAAWGTQRAIPPLARRTGLTPFDAVFAMRLSDEGKPLGREIAVAGSAQSPACGVTVASDGAGSALIAYEKHPDRGDVPIKIAFRMLAGSSLEL